MATQTRTRLQVLRRRPRQYQWAKSLCGDLLAFLIGLANCYTLKLVGDIPFCELILIPVIPLLLIVNRNRLKLHRRKLGIVLSLLLLWLLGQIVTDIYRSSAFEDWIRGNASIFFYFLDIIGMTLLLKGNVHRQLVLYFGLGISYALIPRFQPDLDALASFKFAYAWSITYLATLVSCYFYKKHQFSFVGLLFLACIGANLIFNRSIVLMLFVTICLVLPVIPEHIGRLRLLPPAQTQSRVVTIIGIVLVAGAVAGEGMSALAASGTLGYAAQQKNQNQTMAGWGLLIGGRPEILVSSQAVIDSPILGHGSWARDPKYIEMLAQIEAENGMQATDEEEKFGGIIPAHSHLMGAWVLAGILGAVFWIYLLTQTVKATVRSAMLQLTTAPAYILLLVRLAWDILFSPFGAYSRLSESFIIVIICDLLDPDSKISSVIVPVFQRARIPVRTRNLGRVSSRIRGRF